MDILDTVENEKYLAGKNKNIPIKILKIETDKDMVEVKNFVSGNKFTLDGNYQVEVFDDTKFDSICKKILSKREEVSKKLKDIFKRD